MVGNRQLSGFIAWMVWLVIHLMEITQFSNRILVLIQWGGSFVLRNRSARLITHESLAPVAAQAPQEVAA
jgi:NADH:ubiquinone reductase (H+-translocating)